MSSQLFILKLWKLVNDNSTNHVVSWGETGMSFIIHQQYLFSKSILPIYFKHNNMASFTRQLNTYGFRKVANIDQGILKADNDSIEFFHHFFVENHPELLKNIKRQQPLRKFVRGENGIHFQNITPSNAIVPSGVLSDIATIKKSNEELHSKMLAVQKENNLLWSEIMNLRQKSSKQQQMVAKMIQFFAAMISQSQNVASSPKSHNNISMNNEIEAPGSSSSFALSHPLQLMPNSETSICNDSSSPKTLLVDSDLAMFLGDYALNSNQSSLLSSSHCIKNSKDVALSISHPNKTEFFTVNKFNSITSSPSLTSQERPLSQDAPLFPEMNESAITTDMGLPSEGNDLIENDENVLLSSPLNSVISERAMTPETPKTRSCSSFQEAFTKDVSLPKNPSMANVNHSDTSCLFRLPSSHEAYKENENAPKTVVRDQAKNVIVSAAEKGVENETSSAFRKGTEDTSISSEPVDIFSMMSPETRAAILEYIPSSEDMDGDFCTKSSQLKDASCVNKFNIEAGLDKEACDSHLNTPVPYDFISSRRDDSPFIHPDPLLDSSPLSLTEVSSADFHSSSIYSKSHEPKRNPKIHDEKFEIQVPYPKKYTKPLVNNKALKIVRLVSMSELNESKLKKNDDTQRNFHPSPNTSQVSKPRNFSLMSFTPPCSLVKYK